MEKSPTNLLSENKENMHSSCGMRPKTATTRSKKSNLSVNDILANNFKPMTNLCKVSTNIHSIIFSFLAPQELLLASHVCHSLRESASYEHIWDYKISKESRTEPLKNSAKINYLIQHAVLKNYFKPKSKNFKLIGHKRAITSLAIDGDWILTGSKDCYAKLWNVHTKKSYSFEHSDMVTKVMLLSGVPITASADHGVRIWNTEYTGKPGIL